MSRNKILFIVNPESGSKKKDESIVRIEQYFEGRREEVKIIKTAYAGHGTTLTREALDEEYNLIACVGGDGSINEIAKVLINTDVPLGIIPLGSGNGLARHLSIPLDLKKSLDILFSGDVQKIDSGTLNDYPFFVTCGVGFDAEVAYQFSKRSIRGLIGYVKETAKLFPGYSSRRYMITAPDYEKERTAFTITVANSSQYGNDAVIARDASVVDGLLDLCVIKDYPKYLGAEMSIRLFMKSLQDSRFFRHLQTTSCVIDAPGHTDEVHTHIDGESLTTTFPLRIEVVPQSLKVIVPRRQI